MVPIVYRETVPGSLDMLIILAGMPFCGLSSLISIFRGVVRITEFLDQVAVGV